MRSEFRTIGGFVAAVLFTAVLLLFRGGEHMPYILLGPPIYGAITLAVSGLIALPLFYFIASHTWRRVEWSAGDRVGALSGWAAWLLLTLAMPDRKGLSNLFFDMPLAALGGPAATFLRVALGRSVPTVVAISCSLTLGVLVGVVAWCLIPNLGE